MSTSFPSAFDSFTVNADDVHTASAADVNNLQDSVLAIETAIGLNANAFNNYVITPSVASNDLTVAIKTLAGNDPSAADPVSFRIGNSLYTVTAALSVTALDGTNWCNSGSNELTAKDVDYFVYVIGETGASAGCKVGFSRIPYARTMADFQNTTTNEKYIKGNWTNFNSTDAVAVIGRFNAILTAAGPYLWSLTTPAVISQPIYNSRWLTFTPTVTSSVGTITTVGAVTGDYQVDYNKLFFTHGGIITTNGGTAAGAVRITLPFTAVINNGFCTGIESGVSGKMLGGSLGGASYVTWTDYTGAYPGANNANVRGGGIGARLI